MSISVTLPSINGEIEAGITVGVDASLPDANRMPILHLGGRVASIDMVKNNACCWAYNQFTETLARQLFVNGVAVLIDMGFIRKVNTIPDGDWYETVTEMTGVAGQMKDVAAIMSPEEMKKAMTVAIATKANFWLMNHHTGQGAVAGYVKKVLDVFYRASTSEQLVSAAHNLGHFTSTLYTLEQAGIKGLRKTTTVVSQPNAKLTLSTDAKLRFQSMPAGTHRLAVSFEVAKRLVRSVYAPYCPNVAEMAVIPGMKEDIMKLPASFHIGASYLTGRPRGEYNDMDMEHYMGRLGTFILTLFKNSTLAKSPHMKIEKVESYDDYDAEFKAMLIRIQQSQAQARGRILEEQIEMIRRAPEEIIENVRAAFTARPVSIPASEPTPGTSTSA